MKQTLVALLGLLITFSANAQKKKSAKTIMIQGLITETSDYCGGARPSEAMIDLLHSPKPLAQKNIYIKIGSDNKHKAPIYKKVTTDSNGAFSVMLRVGTTYCFIEEWKSLPLNIPKDTEQIKWDRVCFKTRYEAADFTLKVKSDSNPIVKINYHTPCFYNPYCGTYSGPLPP